MAAEGEEDGPRIYVRWIKDTDLIEDDMIMFVNDKTLLTNKVFAHFVETARMPRQKLMFCKKAPDSEWTLSRKTKRFDVLSAWYADNKGLIDPVLDKDTVTSQSGVICASFNAKKFNAVCAPEHRAPFALSIMEDIQEMMVQPVEGVEYVKFPACRYLELKKEMGEKAEDVDVPVLVIDDKTYGQCIADPDDDSATEVVQARSPQCYFSLSMHLKYDSLKLAYSKEKETLELVAAGTSAVRAHYLLVEDRLFKFAALIRIFLLLLSQACPEAVDLELEDGKEIYCVCATLLERIITHKDLRPEGCPDYTESLIDLIVNRGMLDGLISEDGTAELSSELIVRWMRVYTLSFFQ